MNMKHILLSLVTLILTLLLPSNIIAQVTCGVTPFTITAISYDESCLGTNDGGVDVQVTGGVGPFTYSWDNGLGAGQSHFGIAPNTYTVTVTDVGQGSTVCNDVAVVNAGYMMTTSITSLTDATCGQPNGSFCITPSGGTAPFQYNIGGAPNTTGCWTGLSAGTYSANVTDANGCTAVLPVTIQNIAGPTASNTAMTPATCFGGCDGQATVVGTGGTGPYTIQWDANAGNQVGSVATNLCAGTYQVTVTDANACVNMINVTVNEAAQIYPNVSVTMAQCTNSCDGIASSAPIGGSGGYTFLWLPGGLTASTETGLCGGQSYQLTVTDFNGCTADTTITIASPNPLTGSVTPTDPLCAGSCDGSIDITALTGGTPGYTFEWFESSGTSTGQIWQTATNLCPGDYYVVVTDNSGCTWTSPTVTINDPTQLVATYTQVDVSCNGLCDATLSAAPAGGVAPYLYLWSTAETTPSITGLCPGVYQVQIVDDNGCTTDTTFIVTEPTALTANVNSFDQSCFSNCDGNAVAVAVGGTSGYTYEWLDSGGTPISNAASVTGLCAGNYTLNITDGAGCFYSTNVSISAPPAMTTATSVMQPSCSQCDGTLGVNVTSGGVAVAYTWSPAANLNDPSIANPTVCDMLSPIMYYVTVVDANGCAALDSVLVTSQCDSVYPGDTNYDNIANNNDLLPIGLAYSTSGPVRPSASLAWVGQVAPNWTDTLTGAVNYKHIDTNGDGVIDDNDTTAIIQNYGMAHAIGQWKPRGGAGDPDLYFTLTTDTLQPNTPFTADLELGTPSTPADDVYGLAYTVWFNEETLDSASGVYLDFSNSWIGTEGTDMITIQHLTWQQGQLDVAMVRIDGSTVSGWGPIGACHAVTTDNLSGKSNKATVSETLTLDLSHVTIINNLGEDIPVNVFADSVVVMDTATSIGVVPNWHYEVNAFPVPSKDKLTITTGSYKADKIALYNAIGGVVYLQESINNNRLEIDLENWPNGVYFLEVEVAGQRVNRRIVVSH